MSPELTELHEAYVKELRDAKRRVERWFANLLKSHAKDSKAPDPKRLWPMGPASHPWIIAVVRKYWFRCIELNAKEESPQPTADEGPSESRWGQETSEQDYGPIIPKVFVYDLLAGEKTDDLYTFLQFLCFVPIGVKDGEDI
jgi:hypothetical protein